MFFKKKNSKNNINIDNAICTLLIHAAKTDGQYDENEKNLIKQYFIKLKKNDAYIDDLMIKCEKNEKDSVEIFNLTKEKKKINYNHRLEIIEIMLKIIYSDKNLCHYEDRLIRKVAGLIYIESKDLGNIKIKVKNDLHC